MARPVHVDPQEAVAKAMDLFWEHGYQSVSVDEIVQSTGLNRHTLYNKYGSKFGLLTAALTEYRTRVLDRIEQLLDEPGTCRERIQNLLRVREPHGGQGVWDQMLTQGCFAIRVTAELRDSHQELAEELDAFGGRIEELVAEVVRQGQETGEFRRDRTAEDLASVLVSGFLVPLIYTPATPRTDAFLAVLD